MPSKPPEVAPSEEWAYRARARDPLALVKVVKVGSRRPQRVLVRFLDDAYEGREEWVPPVRLKARWGESKRWQAREDRWEAVRAASRDATNTPEEWAAEIIIGALSELGLRQGYNRNSGVLVVDDPEALVAFLDIERLPEDPLSFVDDDGTLVAPWTITLQVAQMAAPLVAEAVLREVDHQYLKQRARALHGDSFVGLQGRPGYMSPGDCAELDRDWEPSLALARKWCGTNAIERFDELAALHVEVGRIGQVAERAISALEAAGEGSTARQLRQELEVNR